MLNVVGLEHLSRVSGPYRLMHSLRLKAYSSVGISRSASTRSIPIDRIASRNIIAKPDSMNTDSKSSRYESNSLNRKDLYAGILGPTPPLFVSGLQNNGLYDETGELLVSPIALRDACECAQCIDQSTRQREFSFTDILPNVRPVVKERTPDGGWTIGWENDIPGFINHTSHFTPHQIRSLAEGGLDSLIENTRSVWDKQAFASRSVRVTYQDYINDSSVLYQVLHALHQDGLVFIDRVPAEEIAVNKIVERIGPIRHTFYGQTFDVKSKPEARNVAYTSKELCLHMDLLYLAMPPKYQFLHSLENTCAGGESYFVDTLKAVDILWNSDPKAFETLKEVLIRYEYNNDGHHFYRARPVIQEFGPTTRFPSTLGASAPRTVMDRIDKVWWSPPFIGRMSSTHRRHAQMQAMLFAAKKLNDVFEDESYKYTTRLEPGTCVIFDNTRILHARKAFDTNSGRRWFRGAYMDEEVFDSRVRTLAVTSQLGQE